MRRFSEFFKVEKNVQVFFNNGVLSLSNGNDSQSVLIPSGLAVFFVDSNLFKLEYSMEGFKKRTVRSTFSTTAKKIKNALFGFSFGYCMQVSLIGIGYKVKLECSLLTLKLGYSHDIVLKIPEGISITCFKENSLMVKSFSKELVGNFLSTLERYKVPDVYENKGVVLKGKLLLKKKKKKK